MEKTSHVPHPSIVGGVMSAMACTQLDSHALSVVSRYVGNPGNTNWLAMKGILRYLRGSIYVVLISYHGRGTSSRVVGYVNSDCVSELDKRRSPRQKKVIYSQ